MPEYIEYVAAQPNPPLVPVDEYLNSSYHPDVEYVNGVLEQRGMPTVAHGVLCILLIEYFAQFRRKFGFMTLSEVRTQIIERARYRIPDIMLLPEPLPEGKVVTTVPWAVIEVASPDDTWQEQRRRFEDYLSIGARHSILLDPEDRLAYRFQDRSLLLTTFTGLELPSGVVPFETEALFQQLVEERGRRGN